MLYEVITVSVNANVGETVLVRVLNGAYDTAEVTFPIEITIIAWDGRALGVPPFHRYSHSYKVAAGTPIKFSVARGSDCLIKSDTPFSGVAEVNFYKTLGDTVNSYNFV